MKCAYCNKEIKTTSDKSLRKIIDITNYLGKTDGGFYARYHLECFNKMAGKDFIKRFNQIDIQLKMGS